MNAVIVLLALSALIGFALGASFSWFAIMISGVVLAAISAAALQIQGFGVFWGGTAFIDAIYRAYPTQSLPVAARSYSCMVAFGINTIAASDRSNRNRDKNIGSQSSHATCSETVRRRPR
jgi:hypothetical protein